MSPAGSPVSRERPDRAVSAAARSPAGVMYALAVSTAPRFLSRTAAPPVLASRARVVAATALFHPVAAQEPATPSPAAEPEPASTPSVAAEPRDSSGGYLNGLSAAG